MLLQYSILTIVVLKKKKSSYGMTKTMLTKKNLPHLQDDLLGAALLSVCQKCSLPSTSLQSQERLDLLQAAGL